MSEIKLKPCPFCGAPGAMRRVGMQWYAECSDDLVDCPVHPWSECYETQEKAAEIWNRRADNG